MKISPNEKICSFIHNPIIIFGIIVIILTLLLFFGCRFSLPDFYINRDSAFQIVQTVPPSDSFLAVEHLLNPKYKIFNFIFQSWSWVITLFVFSLIFRIKTFKNFKELNFLNNKWFVYLWINLSFFLWSFIYVSGYMNNLEKYVYNSAADSMSIPLFEMIGTIIFIGIIYFPLINILSFITFNTKIKRNLYYFIWICILLFNILLIVHCFNWKFTYLNIILCFYYFIWLIFSIYAIGFIKNKQA